MSSGSVVGAVVNIEPVGVKNHACVTDMLGYFFQGFFFLV